jgi:DNA-binding transcriptional LysR family regulator
VAVADAGGVSPAARRLRISKSIVNPSLFRLEIDLGVQLLARTTRGVSLTRAGVTFREHAVPVVAEGNGLWILACYIRPSITGRSPV